MVELVEVDEENFESIIKLKMKPKQVEYLPDIAVFLARAYLNLKYQHPDYCFGLLDGDKIVEFTKIVLVPANEGPLFLSEDHFLLDALLVDAKYQGKGYGEKALSKIIEWLTTSLIGEVKTIQLMCHIENKEALKLYEKFEFMQIDNDHLKNKELLLLQKKIDC